ncbi:DUF4129 domain-containing protein [Isachenkonia alkalipeptolytica]|uniref:DUF4129 domain-containing protein n=1 Tax=Isachenkonia alkalipeptolytica TaxID=2565777 RepID=A0AA44BDK0_9CLOT|nr:DUF4129 domain-containing protein [Isachenkonia alkalipeptolytica]NBG88032.1 DUF4129 domain-containing protein [Isachenkonia alkalipeptolytica]
MEKIKTLTLLHLINVLSLLFMVGNVLLRLFHDGHHYGGLFLWSLLMSGGMLFCKGKTRFFGGWLLPWVLLPLLMEIPLYQIGYLAVVGLFILLLFYKNMEDPHYDRIEHEFGVGIAIAGVLWFFILLMGGVRLFNNVAAGYLLIYILSGVLMLRSLRYLEHSGDHEQLKRINLRSVGIVVVLSIILSTDFFMKFFQQTRSLLWMGYNLLIDVVLWVLYWPIYYIGTFINYIIAAIMQEPQGFTEEGGQDVAGDMQEIHENVRATPVAESPVFRILIAIILFAAVFFILYKVYTRKAMTRRINETYSENKEMILPNKKGDLWNAIKSRLKPKTKEDRIRIYYGEFLEKLEAQGAVLLPSDTTQDYHRKGKAFYSENELARFRSIYLQVRYGEKAIDSKTYKEAKGIYGKFINKEE